MKIMAKISGVKQEKGKSILFSVLYEIICLI